MDLRSEREVANTRKKLQRLEELYEAAENETSDDEAHTQVVRSMEIDRVPVFSAERGQEIGMKVERAADVGTTINSIE